MRASRDVRTIIFPVLLLAAAIAVWAGTMAKGGIVILENPNGAGFTMEFNDWSARNKCELSLQERDTLQIEVSETGGKVDLTIRGKNGSEPYVGRNLRPGIFTVTVSEADAYVFEVAGDGATGKIAVKNLERER